MFLYAAKNPAWDLFKNIPFDIIILEILKIMNKCVVLNKKIKNMNIFMFKVYSNREEFRKIIYKLYYKYARKYKSKPRSNKKRIK